MSGGSGGGKTWIVILVVGCVLCGIAVLLHGGGPGWLTPALQAVGGLMVVFGSCEAMILSVEGLGERLRWNDYVAGTIAGLASNIPEVMMLGFVVLKEPRVAFVVVALTLHVNALVFGGYCGLLPRDQQGRARLPEPMVQISTDLYAGAGVIFLAMGSLMIVMRAFRTGLHQGEALGAGDLYMLGAALLFVETVAVVRLIKRFSGVSDPEEGAPRAETEAHPAPSMGLIAFYGALGTVASIIGGHAVGEFADALVGGLKAQGVSEMIGAIILSVFSGAGCFAMVAMAHVKKKYDIALSNVSGAITQVPFVVLPIVMMLIAAFAQLGMLPAGSLPSRGVLTIDLETTSVVVFGFPTMLIMWKSIQDDGIVNWVETASMIALFGVVIYFLAVHG